MITIDLYKICESLLPLIIIEFSLSALYFLLKYEFRFIRKSIEHAPEIAFERRGNQPNITRRRSSSIARLLTSELWNCTYIFACSLSYVLFCYIYLDGVPRVYPLVTFIFIFALTSAIFKRKLIHRSIRASARIFTLPIRLMIRPILVRSHFAKKQKHVSDRQENSTISAN